MSITSEVMGDQAPAEPRRAAAESMEWVVAITAFDTWAATERRPKPSPETTRRTRREHLQLIAKHLPRGPWATTGEDLVAWFESWPMKPNTYRSRRTTMRAFYSWAVAEGHVTTSPAVAIAAGEVPVPIPRPVPDRIYDDALAHATPRERLMCRLAAEHGLRREEVAVVHSSDLFEDLDGWTLVVHGKGGKERLIPLLDDVAGELRALPSGWAFPGRINGHLSPRWVGKLLSRLLLEDYTMHKLRHRAGTRFYEESDFDLFATQELLGHSSANTTRVYVRVNATRLRRTVNRAADRRGPRSSA